jgi:bacteriocin biosynthesis cyclodehydratase domain-containing protein
MDQQSNEEVRLRSFPAQFIEFGDRIIVRRGAVEVALTGQDLRRVVQVLFTLTTRPEGATPGELIASFSPEVATEIGSLVQLLREKRIFVEASQFPPGSSSAEESELDVFFWNFGRTAAEVKKNLESVPLILIGVNRISLRIAEILREQIHETLTVVDDPAARNTRFFTSEGRLRQEAWPAHLPRPRPYLEWGESVETADIGCLVTAVDHGGQHVLREWNAQCVENRVQMLPVSVANLIGWVGPIVIPGETPCYECLRARQNANVSDPDLVRAAESAALEGQRCGGFHPSIANLVAEFAVLELTKFYGRGMGPYQAGTLVRVNGTLPQVTMHRVLKVPRCPVCSPLHNVASTAVRRSTYIPGNIAYPGER